MLGVSSGLSAQAAPGVFDRGRAWVMDSTVYPPLRADAGRSLVDLLAEGVIHNDTPLLLLERERGRIGLLTEQMSYHHVAQGDIDGEPWMVSF